MTTEKRDLTEVVSTLERDEQLESLSYLVDKLPTFVSTLQAVEDKLAFVAASMQDERSLELIADDVEGKIERLHIDSTHLDAMMTMVQLLPRLVPVIEQVDNVVAFAESVWGDKRTVDQLTTTMTETVKEYVPIDKGKAIIEETKEEFERTKDDSPITIFGLMKMLKDPVVQDGLKYAQAFLTTVQKHRN